MAGSVRDRHEENAYEAYASPDNTGLAKRLVGIWKRAVAQVEEDFVRFGCMFVALDVVASLSACFVPFVAPLLNLARLGALAILVPGVLRALAIRYAKRPDSELMIAIAVAVGVAAVYLVVRTILVVEVCAL